jgi:broad specificity phosphatase PhoE
LTPGECQRQFPTEYASFQVFDADFVIPGGESRGQHWARVSDWILDVSSTHREVLAITHGGTIDFLYRLGTGQPLHGGSQVFSGENASLSIFEVRWPDVQLVNYSSPLGA